MKLSMLLEGKALAVWLELTDEQLKDHKAAKKELVAKVTPVRFYFAGRFSLMKAVTR